MSVSVYILVQTVHDKGKSAADAIGQLQYVESVEFLEGPYDVIAKAVVPSDEELGKFLLSQVRGIEGVFRTVTLRVLQI
jgi:DNA-binding Lrp family transcriptional regulator